ncbi:MAG TPA: DUF192 domain-containing protein [Gaiellaceae bacterium]|nr:DUF192 domain-containing protein [Gaiellaceae bacterium]
MLRGRAAAPRGRLPRYAAALAAPVAAAAGLAAVAAPAPGATALLRLDGAPIRPELALTPAARARGLMFRTRPPRDGMLFVFPVATSGGFWMKNTLVPLRIVFFDSRGRSVRSLRMTPCLNDPCRVYDPGRAYRFALELPAADRRPARRLGPLPALRRLVLRAI